MLCYVVLCYGMLCYVMRESCSSSTGRHDVYAIRPALVYESTSLVSVHDSICLPSYFLLPIHYH